jgi:hypothetical protein
MSRSLELPGPIYEALVEAARASGIAPADWIATKLSGEAVAGASEGDRPAALERMLRFVGSIDLGHPTGTDNEAIDADLTREYGEIHEAER